MTRSGYFVHYNLFVLLEQQMQQAGVSWRDKVHLTQGFAPRESTASAYWLSVRCCQMSPLCVANLLLDGRFRDGSQISLGNVQAETGYLKFVSGVMRFVNEELEFRQGKSGHGYRWPSSALSPHGLLRQLDTMYIVGTNGSHENRVVHRDSGSTNRRAQHYRL